MVKFYLAPIALNIIIAVDRECTVTSTIGINKTLGVGCTLVNQAGIVGSCAAGGTSRTGVGCLCCGRYH